jgi:hypothetical protein
LFEEDESNRTTEGAGAAPYKEFPAAPATRANARMIWKRRNYLLEKNRKNIRIFMFPYSSLHCCWRVGVVGGGGCRRDERRVERL